MENSIARNKLFEDLWDGNIPNRVPINQGVNAMCAIEHAGFSLLTDFFKPEKVMESVDILASTFKSDVLPIRSYNCMESEDILGNIRYTYSEDGVRQHENICSIEAIEYPLLAQDPEKFVHDVLNPRIYKKITLDPDIQKLVYAKADNATKEFNRFVSLERKKLVDKYELASFEFNIGGAFAPFDRIADFMRSFTTILSDIRRCPEELLDALNSCLEYEKNLANGLPSPVKGGRVFFTLHMATFMRTSDFTKF